MGNRPSRQDPDAFPYTQADTNGKIPYPAKGEKGYGWLPYAYVLEGLANEFWSLIKSE